MLHHNPKKAGSLCLNLDCFIHRKGNKIVFTAQFLIRKPRIHHKQYFLSTFFFLNRFVAKHEEVAVVFLFTFSLSHYRSWMRSYKICKIKLLSLHGVLLVLQWRTKVKIRTMSKSHFFRLPVEQLKWVQKKIFFSSGKIGKKNKQLVLEWFIEQWKANLTTETSSNAFS